MFKYDPVCGKRMNRNKAYATVEEHGELFYLCCPQCQLMFESDPDEYIRAESKKRHKHRQRRGSRR